MIWMSVIGSRDSIGLVIHHLDVVTDLRKDVRPHLHINGIGIQLSFISWQAVLSSNLLIQGFFTMPEINRTLRIEADGHVFIANQLAHVPVSLLKVQGLNLAGNISIWIYQKLWETRITTVSIDSLNQFQSLQVIFQAGWARWI